MSEEAAEYRASSQAIIPTKLGTISFYGKHILVVRLPDGRPGVVVNSLCDNMGLERTAQVRRIQRTPAIADDLIPGVQIETEGGPQRMQVLVLRSVPFWLAGIDPGRAREEVREAILTYQRECVDVLYEWAQGSRALIAPVAQTIVPADIPARPAQPAANASLDEWRSYHLRMAAFIDWQMEIQAWQGTMEAQLAGVETRMDEFEGRLESKEAVTSLIPEILDRLGQAPLTQAHREAVRTTIEAIWKRTGTSRQALYFELNKTFHVAEYATIPDAQWPHVSRYLRRKLDEAKGDTGEEH